MGLSGIGDVDFAGFDLDFGLALDEVSEELLGVALLEAAELLGQHAVEGVGDHSHHDVEVNLHQDGRRQGVEMKEMHRFGDDVLHPPSSGVIPDQPLHRRLHVVGDEEGRFFPAVATDDDLANLPFVIPQRHERLMNMQVGVLPFLVGDVYLFPRGEPLQSVDQFLAPAPEGDELDLLTVQLGKVLVGGELGVKDKRRRDAPFNLIPEGQEAQNLLRGFFRLDIRGGVKDQLRGSVLGEEGQGAFHPFPSGPRPMVLENGFISPMGDGVEVQIDDAPVIQPETDGLLYKTPLEAKDVDLVQRVGIRGHGRTLGQHVESSKQTHSQIKGVIPHMGIPFDPDEFESQKGQEVACRRNDFRAGKTSGAHQIRDVELLNEWGEQKNPRRLRVERCSLKLSDTDRCRTRRNLRPSDGQTDLEAGAAGKLGEALFRQDPLHSTNGDVIPLFREQLGDLSCGEVPLPPRADLLANVIGHPVPRGAPFRNRFGEVKLTCDELVSEEMHIAWGVSKTFRDDGGGESFDNGCPQGFVSTLPVVNRMGEVGGVPHGILIYNDGDNVKNYFVKTYDQGENPHQ